MSMAKTTVCSSAAAWPDAADATEEVTISQPSAGAGSGAASARLRRPAVERVLLRAGLGGGAAGRC